jgi:hypothetical protein
MIRRVERCLQRFPLRFFTLIDRDVPFILPILAEAPASSMRRTSSMLRERGEAEGTRGFLRRIPR